MKKTFKKFLDKGLNKVKELSLEEANLVLFGTNKPIIGQKIVDINHQKNEDKIKINLNNLENNKLKDLKFDITTESTDIKTNDYKIDGSGGFVKSLTPIKPLIKNEINPQQVQNMKLDKVYKLDTIQLIESLKYIELKKENINKLINFLAVLRKKKEMKIYDFPVILETLVFIRTHLHVIAPSYLISLLYSLSKLQNFDDKKPSLDDQSLIFEILKILTNKIEKIDTRGMSNLTYGLQIFQMKNPEIYNFDKFFGKLEEQIISNLSKNINLASPQDISNIIIAYCKTQNGSEEFYQIMQELIIDMINLLKPQDIAVILYSYANNPTCNEKLLENLEETVKKNISYYKPKEICSVLRAYDMRKMLNDDLKMIITEAFIQKHELTNATDLAFFYSKLVNSEDKRFLKYSTKCIANLYFTFNPSDLAVLFEKADIIYKLNPELYRLLQKQISKLIKKREFEGYHLKKIYLNIKELPFEGKYNLFVEEIERELERIKYF